MGTTARDECVCDDHTKERARTVNDDIDRTHEGAAPRDDAPYLGRPKKPRPKPELFRPVKLPGTEWKRGHARFDQSKRIWTAVKGHWAKIPKRRDFDDAA